MTEKQKAAFLKSEGWSNVGRWWGDPRGGAWGISTAYRIASRRRNARLRRIVKAAGYKAVRSLHMPGWWWMNEDGVRRSLGRAAGRVELLAKAAALRAPEPLPQEGRPRG